MKVLKWLTNPAVVGPALRLAIALAAAYLASLPPEAAALAALAVERLPLRP